MSYESRYFDEHWLKHELLQKVTEAQSTIVSFKEYIAEQADKAVEELINERLAEAKIGSILSEGRICVYFEMGEKYPEGSSITDLFSTRDAPIEDVLQNLAGMFYDEDDAIAAEKAALFFERCAAECREAAQTIRNKQ